MITSWMFLITVEKNTIDFYLFQQRAIFSILQHKFHFCRTFGVSTPAKPLMDFNCKSTFSGRQQLVRTWVVFGSLLLDNDSVERVSSLGKYDSCASLI